MKKHGKLTYILFVIIASVILSAFLIPKMIISINESLAMEITILDINAGHLEDGVYAGEYSTAHMACAVEVTVISGQMTNIDITDCSGISLTRASQVREKILTYQSLNIPDGSVGGEVTDVILLKAVEYTLVYGEEV